MADLSANTDIRAEESSSLRIADGTIPWNRDLPSSFYCMRIFFGVYDDLEKDKVLPQLRRSEAVLHIDRLPEVPGFAKHACYAEFYVVYCWPCHAFFVRYLVRSALSRPVCHWMWMWGMTPPF